jgi:microcystin-dependent protein
MAKRFIGGDTSVAPAGSIQAFAGANVPHGWLLCDGEVYDISEFPALASALDGTWDSFAHPVDGTPSVGAGQFAVPNMKGLYLSGAGNAGGDARSLGVFQSDEIASHNHQIYVKDHTGAPLAADSVAGTNNTGSKYSIASAVRTNGGAETRPKTAPVNYIIKY